MNSTTGVEAIRSWVQARQPGEAIRSWVYSPNGGAGGPLGRTEWGPDEWVKEVLGRDWPEDGIVYDPVTRKLSLQETPERGVWQYYDFWYEPAPDRGKRRIAYFGDHSGFVWMDDEARSPHLKAVLAYLLQRDDEEGLAALGLSSCEDYDAGDDGGYWLVSDETRFSAVLAKCKAMDVEDGDPEDIDPADLDAETIVNRLAAK